MAAVRFAIVAKVEAGLSAIPAVSEIELMPSADPASFPALHIFDNGDHPITGEPFTLRRQLDLTIEGYVEAHRGPAALEALNDLRGDAIRALFADYNIGPIGGLAEDIEEGALRISVAPLTKGRRLAFSQDIIITYAVRRGDPDQQ